MINYNLPWSVYESFVDNEKLTGKGACQLRDSLGITVGFVADRVKADMIVNVVNEYASLLDAIEESKISLEVLKQEWAEKDKQNK